jgi:hypothetical protein
MKNNKFNKKTLKEEFISFVTLCPDVDFSSGKKSNSD